MTPRRFPPCFNWKENRLNRLAAEMRARNLYSGVGCAAQRKAILQRIGGIMPQEETNPLLSDLAELEALGLVQSFHDHHGEMRYAIVWQAILIEQETAEAAV